MDGSLKRAEALLSTRNLSVGYSGSNHALFSDINIDLFPGQLVCFMGPNGIGKSTLIRTLAGLQEALSGEVSFDTYAPLPYKLSVVLTDKVSSVNLTVKEVITFGRYPYLDWNIRLQPEDVRLVEGAIEQLGIGHLANRKVYELSDGQLQMTMIARALAQDTDIILLDEPTSHLDLNNRVEIMNLLQKVCHQSGKAILVSTHELDLALQTADLIWLAGRNGDILTGIPEDLVLNGAFDAIFMFKGFDLKTGRILHEAYRNVSILFAGQGHNHLWTKNALERNGYTIQDAGDAMVEIRLYEDGDSIYWELIHEHGIQRAMTIKELLALLQSFT